MSDPIVDPSDLATYLNDPGIDEDRAELMINGAQSLCESIMSPLPDIAAPIVLRVAARGYTTVLSPRQTQMQAAGSPYGGSESGALRLWREDKADLQRLNGSGGGFSIDLLPKGYVLPSQATYGFDDITTWS